MDKKLFITILILSLFSLLLISCGHEHTPTSKWEQNETEHWRICSGEGCAEVIDKEAHDFKVTSSVAPTCTEKGLETSTCKDCGYVVERVLDALGHEEKILNVVVPTCISGGKTEYECTREGCDFIGEKDVIQPLGHDWADQKISATCVTNGRIIRTCKAEGCNVSIELVGDAATGVHTPVVEVVRKATCTAEGEQIKICGECGIGIEDSSFSTVIPATGHTFDGIYEVNEALGVKLVNANCDNDGYLERICKRCQEADHISIEEMVLIEGFEQEFIDDLKKWGHKFEEKVRTVEPTCVEKGYTLYRCTNPDCGQLEKLELVDELTHNFLVSGEANCKTEGRIPYKCDRICNGIACNETKLSEEAVIDAKHIKAGIVKEATCCDRAVYVCFVCQSEYNAYDGDAVGMPTNMHNYSIKGETFAPTCDADGYTAYYCSAGDCGTMTKKNIVDKLSHTLGEISEEGTVICTVCYTSFVDISAEKIAGSDKICMGCGTTPCTCESSADWEGYVKPQDPEAITAGVSFEKTEIVWKSGKTNSPLQIGKGLIVLASNVESNYTVKLYSNKGDAEPIKAITVSGDYVIIDLFKYESVCKVVIDSSENSFVSFYNIK